MCNEAFQNAVSPQESQDQIKCNESQEPDCEGHLRLGRDDARYNPGSEQRVERIPEQKASVLLQHEFRQNFRPVKVLPKYYTMVS